MRDLFNFFVRHSTFLLLLVYVVISCVLLFSSNPYQHSIYLTSANNVTSSVNGMRTDVTGYFNLKSVNSGLMSENARLENEVLNLREEIKYYRAELGDSLSKRKVQPRFDYVLANVLNNSTRHKENYFTIDKGAADGIKVGMGVADFNGAVGMIDAVGEKTSRVISLLHTNQPFSAKIKGTNHVGSIIWKGTDPKTAYLTEILRHATFHVGDTVVSTGFTPTFPEGVPFGVIENMVKVSDDNYFTIKVRLASDFSNLSNVRVIKDTYKSELESYEADKDEKVTGKKNKGK